MIRDDRQIADIVEIENIIKSSVSCRLGLSDDGQPYVVPMSFGYDPEQSAIYFHSAREGRKVETIRKNPRVCVEFDIDLELVEAKVACGFTMKYRSVIAFGKASIIDDPDGKIAGYDILMRQYSDAESFEYKPRNLADSVIIKVDIETMTGKRSL